MFKFNHEYIQELIARLKTESEDSIILVEGKKDKKTLRKLGIDSKIFLLQANCRQFAEPRRNSSLVHNKSLVGISEELAKKSDHVILMLDSDPKGRELTKKMKNHLQAQGVHVDTKLGKSLLWATNSHTIESTDKILKLTGLK